jgi:tRNA modification GTPase
MYSDTIVAFSTQLTQQAVSIIRLSGDQACSIVETLIQKSLEQSDHLVSYAQIFDPETKHHVDEVLVLTMKAPRSYTREDVVEIQCHGGVYVAQKILSLCLGLGARLAERGEFTQRAMMNGRIDLAQAEAIQELIEANSEQSARLAIASLKGSLKHLIDPLLEELIQIIAHIEVNIDYPEYDLEEMTRQKLLPLCEDFHLKIQKILDQSKTGQILREGVKTAIIGKPNVGKSSLLNALLNEDKAIVTEIAGTTRDVVEGWIRLKHVSLHLLDTAGIRHSDDRVERLGIDKTYRLIQEADLILFVIDAQLGLDEEESTLLKSMDENKVMLIYNKKDLSTQSDRLEISALNKDIHALIEALNHRYQHHEQVLSQPVLSTPRTIGLAMQAKRAMEQAIESIHLGREIDLINIDLSAAYQALHAIVSIDTFNLSDELFARFCLGK